MRTKWLLFALPLGILGVLLQSSLWVPSYASQAEGNPARLETFLRASLGEVKQLNPVVSYAKNTLDIMDRTIFEGLMEADENLKLVPRLAEHLETTEQAYLAVLEGRTLPDGSLATPQALLAAIAKARENAPPRSALSSILSAELVPGETRQLKDTVIVTSQQGRYEPVDVGVTVDVPARVKLTLAKVEPHLFRELEPALGASYFSSYPFEARFKLDRPELLPLVRPHFPDLLAIGEHNPVLTFHLRSGVRWHDGAPFTAEDVKFTYLAVMDPRNASPRTGGFEPVKSVDVVDPLTVRVVYKRLYAQGVIDWDIGIVPKHLLDAAGLEREARERALSATEREQLSLRTTTFNRRPVGTGPFRFVSWLPDQYIRLARNDAYWGKKSGYRDVYFRAIPDYLTMEVEFGAGALDMYEAMPHQAQRYRHDPQYRVLSNDEGAYAFIGYNIRLPLFQDVRVRRALGMALDTESIIQYVLAGEGKRATGPYYSVTPYADPDVKPLPYDPQAALQLLEQAGWHKGPSGMLEKDGQRFAFTLVTNSGNPQRKAIMAIAQEAWKKLGIDCKVQAFEWTVFLEDFVQTQKFDAIVMSWAGGAINPDKYPFFHSSQTHPYETNYMGYQSAEADQLLVEIREAYDEQQLLSATRKLHRLLARDQPTTFLYEPRRPIVLDKRVARVERLADGRSVRHELATPPGGDVFNQFSQWRKFSSAAQPSVD